MIFFLQSGAPNMPQYVISRCIDGTESDSPLPVCLPMSDVTWV